MTANGKQEQFRLGFLTAIEVPEKGFVGGLLVTTQHGRPLEFQCTVPVKPNATQEILYGPTLAPFILGELIGATLIEKAGIKPHLVLTDREQILELRNYIDSPVAYIPLADVPADGAPSAANQAESKARTGGTKLGRQIIHFHPAHSGDSSSLVKECELVPADANLCEPFDRVRDALQETLRCGALR